MEYDHRKYNKSGLQADEKVEGGVDDVQHAVEEEVLVGHRELEVSSKL